MLCQKCKKNEANVFYRENVNGKEKSYALCSECAHELEKSGEISKVFDDFGPFGMKSHNDLFDLNGLFGSLFGGFTSAAVPTLTGSKRCPVCGESFADFTNSGKAGCPKCYEEFADELDGTISRIHGNTTHKGRVPKGWKSRLDRETQIKQLKKELETAIGAEEFEKAAELRDRIRQLGSEK